MIAEFLISKNLCERVDQDIIDQTNLKPKLGDSAAAELFFLPALMSRIQRPQSRNGICTTLDNSRQFEFGWCLQCINQDQFFTARFLHLLILRLAYENAQPKLSNSPHQLSCYIWPNGITWSSSFGVQSLVEMVNDQCVLFLTTSCHEGFADGMIESRRMVIQDILSLFESNCSSVDVTQSVIDPAQLSYPIDDPSPSNLHLYYLQRIASAVADGKPCVVSSIGKDRNLSDIMPLEYKKGKDMSIFVTENLKVRDS